MEIRIRAASEVEAVVLGDIPFRPEVIDAVIPTITSWGGYIGDTEIKPGNLTGQFMDDGLKAYFEVVVNEDD